MTDSVALPTEEQLMQFVELVKRLGDHPAKMSSDTRPTLTSYQRVALREISYLLPALVSRLQEAERRNREARTIHIATHPIQQAIVNLAASGQMDGLSLRDIAAAIGLKTASPQQVKHHLQQMLKHGYLDLVGGKYQVGSTLRGAPAAHRGGPR